VRQAVVHCNDLVSAETLRRALTSAGFEVVDVGADGDVLTHMTKQSPDVVILDLDDGDGSAYLTCKLLRERFGEQLPIILLSGERTTPADRVVGLLLGADDYVVKPFDSSEVVTRARRLVVRSEQSAPRTSAGDATGRIEDFDLTERERQVMERLLLGRTQAEIASELVISSNTVATHIQRILLKLGVHNRAQAVAKVARAGWLQRELDDALAPRLDERADASAART
jgi:DNA-binding NarL/FixJ family response regulator